MVIYVLQVCLVQGYTVQYNAVTGYVGDCNKVQPIVVQSIISNNSFL